MQRFRNILVAIHGDESPQGLLDRAARLAKQDAASIRLFAAVEDFPWYARLVLPDADELQDLIARDRAAALGRLAERLRRDDLSVATGVHRGRPPIEIVREVIRGGHDLLMKVAEPNEAARFGSIDMHLLRACPCPLWLFKPEHAGRGPGRILAAVDPAPPPDEADLLHLRSEPGSKDAGLDARILELAGALADEEGAELHVLHAWSAPGEALLRGEAMLTEEQVEAYVEDARAAARRALDHLLAGVPDRPGRRFVHLLKGDPGVVIADFVASEQVDLIVMGTVARAGIAGLLIGNTAEAVLQRVDCSVLAVKPAGFVSPVALGPEASPTGSPAR